MTYPAHYIDSHKRHWEDAKLLFESERLANADQLFGFSAECGLKAVMQALKMPVKDYGKPANAQHRKHVQDLWPIFKSFVYDRNGERYLRLLPCGEPFADWSHHDRYAHRSHIKKNTVESHCEATKMILLLVQTLLLDGQP